MVEHANDLGAFIADYRLFFFVVKRRYREAPFIVWVHRKVNISQVCAMSKRIRRDIVARRTLLFTSRKWPALLTEQPMDAGVGNEVLQALQLSDNQSSVGPRAGVGDV